MAKIKDNAEQKLLEEIVTAVGAGRRMTEETVDFAQLERPKTCIEVDFPILPINEVAVIEGNADKPIYQISKYWARRSSSVFRAILLAAATKAPEDESKAAKVIWEAFYANHQHNEAFRNLKVAEIFMGGGTTVVEAARLGMQVFGNDLNPVAWFIVKSELSTVRSKEVTDLLIDIEHETRSSLQPFFTQVCPRGHKPKWIKLSTLEIMGDDFDPFSLADDERRKYSYHGPELIYTFWAKHGPCQAEGCKHRTPLIPNPVFAIKTLTVKAWPGFSCGCGHTFDIEQQEARIAPGVPLSMSAQERLSFSAMDDEGHFVCPACGKVHQERKARITGVSINLRKATRKKIDLALLIHPDWLKGAGHEDEHGQPFGGSATDSAQATNRWNQERSKAAKLLEHRGVLPEQVTCPETGKAISTVIGTAPMKKTSTGMQPKKSMFTCQQATCGREWDLLTTIRETGKTAPMSPFAYQAYCPSCDAEGRAYSGRYFVPAYDVRALEAAEMEWQVRRETDLAPYWPRNELSLGWKTHKWGIPDHGYTHYWKMFNSRQLLVLTHILKAIVENKRASWEAKEAVLGAFQQYVRNENMLCFWDEVYDKLVPHFSGNNYSLKSRPVENNVFGTLGRGNWRSCIEGLVESREWSDKPWERVTKGELSRLSKGLENDIPGKSFRIPVGDSVLDTAVISCGSSTDLCQIKDDSIDLVITDPPFSELVQYSELSDFFYVWLAPVLKNHYPDIFGGEFTPKTLEAVENPYRQGSDAKAFYQRLLTSCWKEASRILKPAGLLAFTFHHNEDGPWVQVLESLFQAGFYLEATYPIRGDESKGDGQFGSQKVEYDIIHVCRKRIADPQSISWARLRRLIMDDVHSIKSLLSQHQTAGLPAADLQVIKRGKALEYFSRHYGKVYIEQGREFTIREALVGINQLLDDDTSTTGGPQTPPANGEPYTRQFFRLFYETTQVPRDQMQKFLRGTGISPSDFEERGWCSEKHKVFTLTPPVELARAWKGASRKGMARDFDQAMFLVGGCFEGSNIRVTDTLDSPNFAPHPATAELVDWLARHGGSQEIRFAAQRARTIYRDWMAKNKGKVEEQMKLFDLVS